MKRTFTWLAAIAGAALCATTPTLADVVSPPRYLLCYSINNSPTFSAVIPTCGYSTPVNNKIYLYGGLPAGEELSGPVEFEISSVDDSGTTVVVTGSLRIEFSSSCTTSLHFGRVLALPAVMVLSRPPATPGLPLQVYPLQVVSLVAEAVGDRDFDLLRVTAGSSIPGLPPSSGSTTLTLLPGGDMAVDSFFDIVYRIEMTGSPGGELAGMSGTTDGVLSLRASNTCFDQVHCPQSLSATGQPFTPAPGCEPWGTGEDSVLVLTLPSGDTLHARCEWTDIVPISTVLLPDSVITVSDATLRLHLQGQGSVIGGYSRTLVLPHVLEVRNELYSPGSSSPVSVLDVIFSVALAPGDRDFDLLSVSSGSSLGLPVTGDCVYTPLPDGRHTPFHKSYVPLVFQVVGSMNPASPFFGVASTSIETATCTQGAPISSGEFTVNGTVRDRFGNAVLDVCDSSSTCPGGPSIEVSSLSSPSDGLISVLTERCEPDVAYGWHGDVTTSSSPPGVPPHTLVWSSLLDTGGGWTLGTSLHRHASALDLSVFGFNPQEITVTARLAGLPVAAAVIPGGAVLSSLVTTTSGSSFSNVSGCTCDCSTGFAGQTCEMRYILRNGVPIQCSINGGPPEECDEIEVVCSLALPPGMSAIDARAAVSHSMLAVGTGTLLIENEALITDASSSSTGSSSSLVWSPRSNRTHAEMAGNPVDDGVVILFSNIGSSGQDGVSVLADVDRDGLADVVSALQVNPLYESSPAAGTSPLYESSAMRVQSVQATGAVCDPCDVVARCDFDFLDCDEDCDGFAEEVDLIASFPGDSSGSAIEIECRSGGVAVFSGLSLDSSGATVRVLDSSLASQAVVGFYRCADGSCSSLAPPLLGGGGGAGGTASLVLETRVSLPISGNVAVAGIVVACDSIHFSITAINDPDILDEGLTISGFSVTGRDLGTITLREMAVELVSQVAEQQFIRGDTNNDGAVNIGDPITVLSYLFSGGAGPTCQKAWDSNDDSNVDIGDAITLLGVLFSGAPPPPTPYPTCGVDGTPDALTCVGPTSCP